MNDINNNNHNHDKEQQQQQKDQKHLHDFIENLRQGSFDRLLDRLQQSSREDSEDLLPNNGGVREEFHPEMENIQKLAMDCIGGWKSVIVGMTSAIVFRQARLAMALRRRSGISSFSSYRLYNHKQQQPNNNSATTNTTTTTANSPAIDPKVLPEQQQQIVVRQSPSWFMKTIGFLGDVCVGVGIGLGSIVFYFVPTSSSMYNSFIERTPLVQGRSFISESICDYVTTEMDHHMVFVLEQLATVQQQQQQQQQSSKQTLVDYEQLQCMLKFSENCKRRRAYEAMLRREQQQHQGRIDEQEAEESKDDIAVVVVVVPSPGVPADFPMDVVADAAAADAAEEKRFLLGYSNAGRDYYIERWVEDYATKDHPKYDVARKFK